MRRHLSTVLDLVGAGLVVAAVGLVYVPAAVLVAGALILLASRRYDQ